MTTNYELHRPSIRDRLPQIVAELNELADGNYNLGAMREALPSDCATLLVGLTTELNVQLAIARKREAELVAALRHAADALARIASSSSQLTAEYADFETAKINAALAQVTDHA